MSLAGSDSDGSLPGETFRSENEVQTITTPAAVRSAHGDPDASIAALLSESLGLAVDVVHDNCDHLVSAASRTPGAVQQCGTRGQDVSEPKRVRQALSLPGGGVAVWQTEAEHCEQVARHALAILEVESTRNERHQLNIEVESLTNQVMQDFEELALIRSLASTLQLPQTAGDTDALVLGSLRSLITGVGAVSIAAVLREEDSSQRKRAPLWTGQAILEDQALFDLIDQHADEMRHQPVVRNRQVGSSHCGAEGLREMVMVECASESRLHGWVIACNRVEDQVQAVPWAQLGFTTVQASLMETATHQLAAQLNNIRLLKQKEELFTDVIRALVNAVEARDPYTCGHSERVASFARFLASKIGFTPTDCERIYLTGLLHDVGKIAIPDGVLQKPQRLDDDERAIIETHTDSGWRILQELDALQHVLPGVLYHHEHWNGQGYPDKLAGENIPIDGRILAVCDAFDAMTSDRPYRKGMSIDKAMGILNDGAGTYWDPHLIDTFGKHLEEIDQIRISHQPRTPAQRPTPVDGMPVIGTPGFIVGESSLR